MMNPTRLHAAVASPPKPRPLKQPPPRKRSRSAEAARVALSRTPASSWACSPPRLRSLLRCHRRRSRRSRCALQSPRPWWLPRHRRPLPLSFHQALRLSPLVKRRASSPCRPPKRRPRATAACLQRLHRRPRPSMVRSRRTTSSSSTGISGPIDIAVGMNATATGKAIRVDQAVSPSLSRARADHRMVSRSSRRRRVRDLRALRVSHSRVSRSRVRVASLGCRGSPDTVAAGAVAVADVAEAVVDSRVSPVRSTRPLRRSSSR